jgi:hypothetical protein
VVTEGFDDLARSLRSCFPNNEEDSHQIYLLVSVELQVVGVVDHLDENWLGFAISLTRYPTGVFDVYAFDPPDMRIFWARESLRKYGDPPVPRTWQRRWPATGIFQDREREIWKVRRLASDLERVLQ